ncbi:hypothetical protein FOBRF1_012107 [Fusarium oxysporum]
MDANTMGSGSGVTVYIHAIHVRVDQTSARIQVVLSPEQKDNAHYLATCKHFSNRPKQGAPPLETNAVVPFRDDRLDDIIKKLDRITVAVQSIGRSPSHLPSNSPVVLSGHVTRGTTPSYESSPYGDTRASDNASASDLEGDVSLAEQAVFATNFAQNAIDGGRGMYAWSDITSKLDTLRKSLLRRDDQAHKSRGLDVQVISPVILEGTLQLPTMAVAMNAIQMLKDVTRLKLFCFVEFESPAQFLEYVINAYSDKPSLADLIIVYCGLHALLRDCSSTVSDQARKEEFASQAGLCRKGLELVLANLPFDLPNTFEFVLALFMASTFYLEICRITTAWTYNSAAAQMCLTLGFHRDVPFRPETREQRSRRIRLFWFVHMVDKMVSLRLNRSSVLRDTDITTPVEDSERAMSKTSFPIIPKWVKISMLQGKVYDDLYSPGALLQPENIREAKARELAAELQATFDAPSSVEDSFYHHELKAVGESFQNLFIRADRINHLAVLTLVYRAIRPNTLNSAFCSECLIVAKECLFEHKTCLAQLRLADPSFRELYVHWALVAAPFTPFIVLFCHTIETGDESHLKDLATVIKVLEMLPSDAPVLYGKQLRLFKMMYDVASRCVAARSGGQEHPPDTPFNMLFSEAGIDPPATGHAQTDLHSFQYLAEKSLGTQVGDAAATQAPTARMDMDRMELGAELGAWFEQNHQVFNILENP